MEVQLVTTVLQKTGSSKIKQKSPKQICLQLFEDEKQGNAKLKGPILDLCLLLLQHSHCSLVPNTIFQGRSRGRMQLTPLLSLNHRSQTPLEATKAKPSQECSHKERQHQQGHQEQNEVEWCAPVFNPQNHGWEGTCSALLITLKRILLTSALDATCSGQRWHRPNVARGALGWTRVHHLALYRSLGISGCLETSNQRRQKKGCWNISGYGWYPLKYASILKSRNYDSTFHQNSSAAGPAPSGACKCKPWHRQPDIPPSQHSAVATRATRARANHTTQTVPVLPVSTPTKWKHNLCKLCCIVLPSWK